MTSTIDTIPEYFKGKNIFITGGSGFLGKSLIEKFLRCCPDIGNIYVLLRPKRGVQISQRLEEIKANILFDKLKEVNPKGLDKIIPLAGDITELQLGLSAKDRETVTDNVTIIFHVAAIVRFDDSLTKAIITNTRATREVCNSALDLKKCDVFIYCSTAYSQVDKPVIEEKLYDNHKDWRKMIEMAENLSEGELNLFAYKMMLEYPNTYTYSKALAECAVNDLCNNKIPTVVVRPTIVIPSYEDPFMGWTDNDNGPIGLLLARAKGVLRINVMNKKTKLDLIPVDMVTKSTIIAAWYQQYLGKKISTYNCSSENILSVTPQDFADIGRTVINNIKLSAVWHPSISTTESQFIYMFNIYLFHVLPAFFLDFVLKLQKKKPMVVKIQRKIFVGTAGLSYFMLHQWIFENDKMRGLSYLIADSDRQDFYEDLADFNFQEYYIKAAEMVAMIRLGEKPENKEKNGPYLTRLKYLHFCTYYPILIYFYYLVFIHILYPLMVHLCNYVNDL